MGFYGHITNIQKTSMTFDRIYSSRTAMDGHVKTDGVYAGRYVLVEYDSPMDPVFLSGVIQFDGFLYAPAPAKTAAEIAAMETEDEYLVALEPLKVGTDLIEDIVDNYVKSGAIVVCSADRNFGIVENEDREKILVSTSRKQYFQIATADNKRDGYNLLFNYKTKEYQLGSVVSKEEKVGCAYIEVAYSTITTDSEAADVNYLINFNIDKEHYSTARGYDSTVWQKTYVDGEPKYVMIAELNSVVPILDVTADAPTLAPMMPHFDKDSTNVYYKLHMQPSWGFRVKAASHNLTVPTLDYSGSKITDSTGRPILAGKHKENYPSDEKVTWMNTISDGYDYTNQYLVTDETNVNLGIWKSKSELGENTEAQIDGAIYYNKAGFDKKISTHSDLLPRVTPIVDEISLTPTGFSGHLYPHHTTEGINEVQPDVNELTVMLPSIGDTVADMWDIIYGTAEINGTHKGDDETGRGTGTYERNTVIRWEDAKKVLAKEGLRLVKAENGLPGYTYNDEAVNTLAGVINSAQDIIGMIITNDYPIDPEDIGTIEKLNEDYIYYDSTSGKYYFKKRDYIYTPVDDDFKYEKVDLKNWEEYKDKAWWVDTNNILKPDYIREDTFRPERKYVQGVKVPGKDDDGEPRKFDAVEYEKGKYYLYTDKVRGTNEPLVDDTTKKPYHEYYLSHEARDVNKQYWKITPTPKTLESNTTYYVPNKYYAGYFYQTKIANEDDFERQLSNGVRLFLRNQSSDTYGISIIDRELKSGDYSLIGNRPVFYLTLKTYSATEEEYAAFGEKDSEKPILFASELVKSDGAQNYYVISRKYELFTDEKTIEASPGVYYKLKQEKNKAEYLESGNILKSIYVDNLELEKDVIVDKGYLYFREVVELILNTSENVVNIADAKIVHPKALPENLYQLYTKILDDGSTYKAYKKISAQSSEIVSTVDLGTLKDLYTLKIEELTLGYLSETYYYQITDNKNDYYQSVILDNRLESTKNREYWLPEMINKRKMTAAEIAKGKVAGTTYYIFDKPNNAYKVYTGTLFAGSTYYINSLIDAPEFYYANKYYYQNENGEFVLDTSDEFTEGREYYKDPQLYIYKDPNKFYNKGAIWPLAQNPPENSGIVLATRKETWSLEELKGFDVHYNTLHGLILRLNKMMLQGDHETRDEETIQGTLNKLTDLINRFGTMKPGQLMMVDDTGRMHGTDYTTAQIFSATNFGGHDSYEIESTESEANNEDMWIDIDTIDDYQNPKIIVKHNFTKVKDTISASDNNEDSKDTIDLYTPIVDIKGHVVGHNTETVTLPYGFKKVTLMNNSLNTHSPDDLEMVIEDKVIANNTQDTLIFKAGNEWIKFDATSRSDNDIIHIYHQTEDTREAVIKNTDLNNGSPTIGPILQTFSRDRGGHVNDLVPVSYTLPNGYSKFKSGEAEFSDAQNTMDVFIFKGDDWIKPTVAQGELIYTHINNHSTLSSGIQALGAQTPAFGETFNLQTYTLDDNGHIINKGVETVTLPVDITPLKISDNFDDENNAYVKKGLSLQESLSLLDQALIALTEEDNKIKENIQTLEKNMSDHISEAENTYALIEGNINSETEFEYSPAIDEITETLEDGTVQVVTPAQEAINVTVAELVNIIKNIDDNALRSETTFIYTPEVKEVSHEATQEDVDSGSAAAIGDKVIDIEYVPAEELTIQELFNKVKALEQLLNS